MIAAGFEFALGIFIFILFIWFLPFLLGLGILSAIIAFGIGALVLFWFFIGSQLTSNDLTAGVLIMVIAYIGNMLLGWWDKKDNETLNSQDITLNSIIVLFKYLYPLLIMYLILNTVYKNDSFSIGTIVLFGIPSLIAIRITKVKVERSKSIKKYQ